MLCREIIAVCSEIHTKHINTLCGQNVELLNVKLGGEFPFRVLHYQVAFLTYNTPLSGETPPKTTKHQ
jgi:hypothetical protein